MAVAYAEWRSAMKNRQGLDLVVGWMRKLGLDVTIDQLGNVIGIRAGLEAGNDRITY